MVDSAGNPALGLESSVSTMLRVPCALLLVGLSSGTVAAAPPQSRSPLPESTVAPPIIFPLPPLMTPPAGGLMTVEPLTAPDAAPPRDLFRVSPRGAAHRRTNLRVMRGYGSGYLLGPADVVSPTARAPGSSRTGTLRLSVIPTEGEVFIDSHGVGMVDGTRAIVLPAGPHRVEIRAPDYQPSVFDIRIIENETAVHRAVLERRRPAPPAVAVPAGPTRLYVIPQCYIGNVPPRADRLPQGCDITQVQIVSQLAHVQPGGSARVSQTFRTSSAGVNGFARKITEPPTNPCRTMASSV